MNTKATKRQLSRFEIEEGESKAFLEFETDDGGWMTIWHTEVPEELRHRGLASELAQAAFEHAKKNGLRVDVICPFAQHYLSEHPELKSMTGKRPE